MGEIELTKLQREVDEEIQAVRMDVGEGADEEMVIRQACTNLQSRGVSTKQMRPVWKSKMKEGSSLAACKEELCAMEPSEEHFLHHEACSPTTAEFRSAPSSVGGFFSSLFGGSSSIKGAKKSKKARGRAPEMRRSVAACAAPPAAAAAKSSTYN